MTGILAGKTVIVTGAANGIGKECALLAAREGANVVVNDIGASLRGDDPSAVAAAEVAEEICKAGGSAVANAGSVSDRDAVQAMVDDTIAQFGQLDAIINPAGILRDKMFHKIEDADWDAVIAVHLRGAYNLSRAAIGHFREREAGTFIHFTSTSGIIGAIGQSNYAAAKMGVAGLSRSIAIENASKNVRSNVIAPIAFTRMVASIPVRDEAGAKRVERMCVGLRADQVALLAFALAADSAADVTGQIFCVRGNELVLFSQPRPVRSMSKTEGWSPQAIIDEALPAMRTDFADMFTSANVFGYDPM